MATRLAAYALLTVLTSIHVAAETIRIDPRGRYCHVVNTPAWGVGKNSLGITSLIEELEFRQGDRDHLLVGAVLDSENYGVRRYGAIKYRIDTTVPKAVVATDDDWQGAMVMPPYSQFQPPRYGQVSQRWPVTEGDHVKYAGQSFPRTGKYWAGAFGLVSPSRKLIAVSSESGTYFSDYPIFAPASVLLILLPFELFDAARRLWWFTEIYDTTNGQKVVSMSGKLRGSERFAPNVLWLPTGQFILETRDHKRLSLCSFRDGAAETQPHRQ